MKKENSINIVWNSPKKFGKMKNVATPLIHFCFTLFGFCLGNIHFYKNKWSTLSSKFIIVIFK